MFYTAVILMLIGLLSLLYIVLTSSIEKKNEDEGSVPPPFEKKEEQVIPSVSPVAKPAPVRFPDLPEPDDRQEIPEPVGFPQEETAFNRKFEGTAQPLRPADTLLDRERLQEALKNLEKKEITAAAAVPAEDPQILIQGVLFFDHGRRLPQRMHQLDDLPERFYQELKRAGTANLVIKGRKVVIQCPNAQYYYNTSDLEQILFLPKGVGFVPVNQKRPVPVFITENPSAVKNFIRQHSITPGI